MTDAKLVLAALKRAVKADYAVWKRDASRLEKIVARLDAATVEHPAAIADMKMFERLNVDVIELRSAFRQDIEAFRAVCAEAGIDPEKAGLHPMYLTKGAK